MSAFESGRRGALRPFRSCIIANDDAPLGLVSGLVQSGRRVGQDFGIITYGGTRMHNFISPPLGAFVFPHFETGQKLAMFLIRLIGRRKSGNPHRGERCRVLRSRQPRHQLAGRSRPLTRISLPS
jgi:DNA-binding LacI/PurR family transcriptional regulator